MSEIIVRGARLHNLKNLSFSLPKNRLVVFTGVSSSGKSTMAFDTLHKEGQRQYMESLGMVTYESRPAVDSISGLSPSISVDQRNRNHSPRSTVGTATDVYTYLRVLFARVGHRPCPDCSADVLPVEMHFLPDVERCAIHGHAHPLVRHGGSARWLPLLRECVGPCPLLGLHRLEATAFLLRTTPHTALQEGDLPHAL